MSKQLKLWIFLIVKCIVVLKCSSEDEEEVTTELSHYTWKADQRYYYVRCTRRFTPGFCVGPLIPVWTFVFQLQNCTERLGCHALSRTNRFVTYRSCMRRCRALVDLYTEILAHEPTNLTTYFRSKSWNNPRREMDYSDDAEIDKHVADEIAEDFARDKIEGPITDGKEDDNGKEEDIVDIDGIRDDDDYDSIDHDNEQLYTSSF